MSLILRIRPQSRWWTVPYVAYIIIQSLYHLYSIKSEKNQHEVIVDMDGMVNKRLITLILCFVTLVNLCKSVCIL